MLTARGKELLASAVLKRNLFGTQCRELLHLFDDAEDAVDHELGGNRREEHT